MTIKKLYEDWHEELIAVIKYHGVADDLQGDIANDFYLKVDTSLKNGKAEIIYRGGKWNRSYLFSIVRNIIYAGYNADQRMPSISTDECEIECEEMWEETREELLNKAVKQIPHHFDRRLIEVYLSEGFSIRKMAKEVGISATTIFYSLKKSKEFIKHKLNQYEGTI